MCRYQSPRRRRHQPLLGQIPEECAVEEGLYNKINRQDDETFMSMWRDILFIWIIFPALLFAQFHVSLALENEEDMAISWRKLAPAILLFSAAAWLYRRNICIDHDDNDDKAEPALPLLVVLLPEIFVVAILVLASVQNLTRALDVLLASIIILSALAPCFTRPHDKKSGEANQDKVTRDK